MEEILKAKIQELTELQLAYNSQLKFARTQQERDAIRKESHNVSVKRMEYRVELKQLKKTK